MVAVGEVAPDFELMANDRTIVRLSESIGNRVVLAFYPAAFTGVCTKEMCTFTDSMTRLEVAEAEIFGISVDSIFANAAYSDANELGFPLLSDTNREATEAYGIAIPFVMPGYIASQRAIFVIDPNGIIGYSWVADNPGQEPDYDAVIAYCES